MKYLGLDYGAKRIGTAISNQEGTIAFPRATLDNDSMVQGAIASLIAEERIEAIVVGDTRTLEGGANPVTEKAEDFAVRLHEATHLPVKFAREAGSSVAVSDAGAKAHDDASAAAFILQRYLDGVQ
jgi:putative Holliday junction resolvase